MVDTIILAGGKSTRFDGNKMATLIHEKPLIYYTILPFIDVSETVIVVTGHYDVNYLQQYLAHPKIKVVHNQDYEYGMLSSVQCGAKSTTNNVLIIPGDCPLVKPKTIAKILNSDGDIRVPQYGSRWGHPLYVSKSLVPRLLQEPITSSLKTFRNQQSITIVDVDDANILNDIDQQTDLTLWVEERMETQ
jgi:molybdenum cofactor cytidylyltransferase